jgi:hypothetical protein
MPYPRFPRVFLSCGFDAPDRRVLDWFRRVLDAVEFEVISGEEPTTLTLPEMAKDRIAGSHAFVGVLTRRTKVEGADEWLPPSWVRDEAAIAYSFKKPLVMFAEDGVRVDGIVPQLTKYERWNRDDLAAAAPTVIRFLIALRNELSPSSQPEGDLATIRALSEDLAGIASELADVEKTQEFSTFSWPLVIARNTGRLYTLPEDLKNKVLEAYRAAESVEKAYSAVADARRTLRSSLKGALLFDTSPPPLLPPTHPVLKQADEAAAQAKTRVWTALGALFKAGYPKEWAEMNRRVDEMVEGAEKEATRALLAALFEGRSIPPSGLTSSPPGS